MDKYFVLYNMSGYWKVYNKKKPITAKREVDKIVSHLKRIGLAYKILKEE